MTDEPKPARRRGVSDLAVLNAGHKRRGVNPFVLPKHPPGVFARDQAIMANDWGGGVGQVYQWAGRQSSFSEGLGFLGFPYLAELSQRAEYRHIVETIATEMTRQGFKVGGGKGTRAADLQKAAEKFDVNGILRQVARHDGFFGRAHVIPDLGDTEDEVEQAAPLTLKPETIPKGSLVGFRTIEPVWIYPGAFNSTNPLAPDFYRPTMWTVMTRQVSAERLMTFVGREMPDMLKPAYSFGGLALTQMAKPYVDNWLRARQSVSDLMHSFSVMVLKTDMGSTLEGGDGQDLDRRIAFFNAMRDNKGTFALDNSEEFQNVSAQLGTLDKLQAQAQEQMASVVRIPLIILLAITSSGLNASSEGELQVHDANIAAQQEQLFRAGLSRMLDIVQLSEFGDIDDTVTVQFNPLRESKPGDIATERKTDADTDAAYIQAGVIEPQEVRERLANDPEGPYAGLDLTKEIEPPADPSQEPDPDGEEDAPPEGGDAGFNEADHPRTANGQFGHGGGGAKSAPIPAEKFDAHAYAQSHDDASVTPEAILKHFPRDTADRLRETQARLAERGATVDRHRLEGAGEHAVYSAERRAVQHKVLQEPWTDAEGKVHPAILDPETIARARPADGQKPTFMVLGGRGGSGKSAFAGRVYDPAKFVVLDADKIKERMPEYEGWNAAEVHEESSDLLSRALTMAREQGVNVVLDGTMKSSPGVIEKLKTFAADGYTTEAHYMHLPRQEAAKRAVSRFLGPTGRYVPPEVVLSNTTNEQSFNEARQVVDKWSFHDNNVAKGEKPIKISASSD